jgi:6-phosphofructokinase
MTKYVGVLTAGGDTPGLNAALRALGKSSHAEGFDMQLIGFYDGFRGLLHDRTVQLDENALSGILTLGGTILGTSRDKPHRMLVGDKTMDMTDAMLEVYNRHHLDLLVCIGGGGTQKNAFRLHQKGMNILTLPKSIDNDVAMTDITLGYDTALGIATDAIDRLHSTAHSHHRIILVELMGHRTGWLALGAGIAGGADVILTPEIPYDVNKVAEAILSRSRGGKHFSIVAVSEGALTIEDSKRFKELEGEKEKARNKDREKVEKKLLEFQAVQSGKTMVIARQLESLTGLESRVTILGYVQRGGTPSAMDRLLATELGTAAAGLIHQNKFGIMVAMKNNIPQPVALEKVINKRKTVPLDHQWFQTARRVGTCLGD